MRPSYLNLQFSKLLHMDINKHNKILDEIRQDYTPEEINKFLQESGELYDQFVPTQVKNEWHKEIEKVLEKLIKSIFQSM